MCIRDSHYAARQSVQTSILFGRKLLSGKHDDWQVAERRSIAEALQHIEAGDVGQTQVKNNAVEQLLVNGFDCLFTARHCRDVDVVIAKQFPDAELFGRIVLYYQQPLPSWRHILLNPHQRCIQSLWRGGFGHKGKSAAGEAMICLLYTSRCV